MKEKRKHKAWVTQASLVAAMITSVVLGEVLVELIYASKGVERHVGSPVGLGLVGTLILFFVFRAIIVRVFGEDRTTFIAQPAPGPELRNPVARARSAPSTPEY
jgi:hypothetical protein